MTGMGGRRQTGGLEGSERIRPEEDGWHSTAVTGGSQEEKMVGATQDLPGKENMAEQQKPCMAAPGPARAGQRGCCDPHT